MTNTEIAFLTSLHAMAVSAGTALMWLVGCLSYPLFAYVPSESFQSFHAQHCRRISWPVGAILLCQGATCLSLYVSEPSHVHLAYLLLTGAGVLITGTLAAPLHTKLGRGYDASLLDKLQRVHALRTTLWTAHLGILIIRLVCS